ncbi:MAG: site-specific recombinase [Thermoleophilaceae bacterium]|nr:site-specific recombinase [Thermoleophilaceae bacterium]
MTDRMRRATIAVMVVDGYVRVSRVGRRGGPRFISPLEQRDQIEGWARLHGATVAEVFEELDQSGARKDRPLLSRALERVEEGRTNGLVVAHLDRFGRSLSHGLEAIERIRKAGGAFVSVADGFDIRTPTGKLVLRIMLSMAEFDLDRIRENHAAARSRAIARGMHLAPRVPLGYVKDEEGHLAPDTGVAPHLREAFRLRAEGAQWSDVADYLRGAGVHTGSGNEFWDPQAVYALVKSRVYRGEVQSGEFVNANAHEPIVDELTWQLARRPVARFHSSARTESSLKSILRCASCRYAMSPELRKKRDGTRERYYACARVHVPGLCPAPTSVQASSVEPLVEAAFFRILSNPPRELRFQRAEVLRRQQELREAEFALTSYRDDLRVVDVLGQDSFVAGLQVRSAEVDKARRALGYAEAAIEAPPVPPADELQERWPALSADERRKYIGRVIDCVFVRRGRVPTEDRLHVCVRGEGPDDLPYVGVLHRNMRPFAPPADPNWWREHWNPNREWSDERLTAELRDFIGEREEWPPAIEFRARHQQTLLNAVYRHGGSVAWARRLGIRPCRRLA